MLLLLNTLTYTTTADVGAYTYGLGHPMKPHRIRVAHELISAYGMLDKMHVLVRGQDISPRAEMADFEAESEARHTRADDRVPY